MNPALDHLQIPQNFYLATNNTFKHVISFDTTLETIVIKRSVRQNLDLANIDNRPDEIASL